MAAHPLNEWTYYNTNIRALRLAGAGASETRLMSIYVWSLLLMLYSTFFWQGNGKSVLPDGQKAEQVFLGLPICVTCSPTGPVRSSM
jgi:hypothetical protein